MISESAWPRLVALAENHLSALRQQGRLSTPVSVTFYDRNGFLFKLRFPSSAGDSMGIVDDVQSERPPADWPLAVLFEDGCSAVKLRLDPGSLPPG